MMFPFTKLNGERFYLNYDLIERIEEKGDVIVYLTNGEKHRIKEKIADLTWLLERFFIPLTWIERERNQYYLNISLIVRITYDPDLVIFLITGGPYRAMETINDVVTMINQRKNT